MSILFNWRKDRDFGREVVNFAPQYNNATKWNDCYTMRGSIKCIRLPD
jgi:hypothetical protein